MSNEVIISNRVSTLRNLLFSVGLCLAATVSSASGIRTVVDEQAIAVGQILDISLAVGDLLVEVAPMSTSLSAADSTSLVAATLTVDCGDDRPKCIERAEKVDLTFESSEKRLKISVSGVSRVPTSGLSVRLRVTVPAQQGTEIDLGAGDVAIRGLEGHIEIDVGVGDVEITLQQGVVRWIKIDTGVGTSRLETDLGEIRGSGVVRSGLEWSQGQGTAHVEVDTGIGDIFVDLQ